MKFSRILLDAGHGINTPGKRSPVWPDGKQYFEWKGMRDLRGVIKKQLLECYPHVEVSYLTNVDHDVSLSNRREIANKYSKDNTLLISLHSNAAISPHAHGFEAFTWPGHSVSDDVAESIIQAADQILPYNIGSGIRTDKATDGDSDKEAKFGILGSNLYSVLIEFGFHSNAKECRWLMNEKQQEIGHKEYSEILVKGLCNWV